MTKKKPSHGPLIAILAGTALVVIAACGGVVFLMARGVSSIEAMAEARRGPSEIVDADYRVRVSLPTSDSDPTWELWGPELARGWSPDGILVLRNESCAAGIVVAPRAPALTLDEELATIYETPGTSLAAPRGGTGTGRAFPPEEDDGATTRAFEHGGTLFRVVGQPPCTDTLYGVIELQPGEITRRWPTPPIENATGRSYRIVDRVFESAATGLRVDANEPFSILLENLPADYSAAEVVVLHRDGGGVTLDPFLAPEPLEPSPEAESFVVRVLDQDTRFVHVAPGSIYWNALVMRGAMGVTLNAFGSDRATAERAARELAPRLSMLEDAALEALRAALPLADRRAGEGWSLRDGVFEEHPAEARPRAVMTLPIGTDVLAGYELEERGIDEEEGLVLAIDRRDLALSGRLLVTQAQAPDAREHLALTATYSGPVARETIAGDAERASTELRLDADTPFARTLHTLVVVRDGWAFALEVWWRPGRDEDALAYARSLDPLLTLEAPEIAMPDRRRYTDDRLGFSLEGGELGVRAQPTGVVSEASAFASTLSSGQNWTAVVAVSDPRASTCLSIALDQIDLERSVGAAWALPATSAEIDGRPATLRVWRDVATTTRVLETRIDRTAYVVVIRGGRTYDWEAALAQVDLDQ